MHIAKFFLKRGVKINLRNAYLKQHDSNSITGTGLSGTNEMASSPLYFIALHHLLWIGKNTVTIGNTKSKDVEVGWEWECEQVS